MAPFSWDESILFAAGTCLSVKGHFSAAFSPISDQLAGTNDVFIDMSYDG